jgi:predicted MPP superfamily phosphohydrolase
VAFVGLEDLEEGRVVDLEAARAGLRAGDVEVVLCHNPLGARAIGRAGCAAILSGHTHAGQIDLPLARNVGPIHPGLRVLVGETLLVVSRGIGAVGLPLRIGAPAEIVHLRLTRRVD